MEFRGGTECVVLRLYQSCCVPWTAATCVSARSALRSTLGFLPPSNPRCSGLLHGIGIEDALRLEAEGVAVHVVDREVRVNMVQIVPALPLFYYFVCALMADGRRRERAFPVDACRTDFLWHLFILRRLSYVG